MKTAELLIVSFCSVSVAQRNRRAPVPGTGSIVGPTVSSPLIRAGPRLPTKKPTTSRKQPTR